MDITATTIDEQLKILASRNIKVPNGSSAALLQYGYYNLINGYKDAFIDERLTKEKGFDYFIEGTTIQKFVNLYHFDAELRHSILSCITIIETQMKSLISLYFSLRFGTNHWNYLRPNSFTRAPKRQKQVSDLIYNLNKSIQKFSTKSPHPAIYHFVQKYNQVPLWVLNTIMTFGTMSIFYDLLPDDMKKTISHAINPKLTPKTLSSILYYLTAIRNKCAHNNRLYTHKIDQRATRTSTIPQLSIHQSLGLVPFSPGAIYPYGQDDILAALICVMVFFGQNHVYQINYDNIDASLSELSKTISPKVESFVRETTGLKHDFLAKLKGISL